jgi:hypothetical protein
LWLWLRWTGHSDAWGQVGLPIGQRQRRGLCITKRKRSRALIGSGIPVSDATVEAKGR